MKKRQHSRNTEVWTDRVPLRQADQRWRNPCQYRAEVWHKVQQSRDATQQKGIFQMNPKKKAPAQKHQNDGNEGIARHKTSEHQTDFIERLPDALLIFLRE